MAYEITSHEATELDGVPVHKYVVVVPRYGTLWIYFRGTEEATEHELEDAVQPRLPIRGRVVSRTKV